MAKNNKQTPDRLDMTRFLGGLAALIFSTLACANDRGVPEQKQKANSFLEQARRQALKIENKLEREITLAALAGGYSNAQNLQAALDTVKTLTNSGAKLLALKDIVLAQVRMGKMKEAGKILKSFKGPLKWFALREIALAYAKAGKPHEASQMAQEMDVKSFRVQILLAVARAEAKDKRKRSAAKFLKKAQQVFLTMTDPYDRKQASWDIALELAYIGDATMANKLLLERIPATKEETADLRRTFLLNLAEVQAKAGYIKEALGNAKLIPPGALDSVVRLSVRQQAYKKIGNALVARGRLEGALDITERMDDPVAKAEVLSAIAHNKGKAGDHPAAKKLFRQAIELATKKAHSSIGFVFPYQDLGLRQICEFQARLGYVKDGLGSLRRVKNEKFRKSIRDEFWAWVALGKLEQNKDQEALTAALSIRDTGYLSIPNMETKGELLRKIAAFQARRKNLSLAKWAAKQKSAQIKSYTYLGLAEGCLQVKE